ncbi:hypothetical protein [Flammeovirga agarivorans]|uniref:Uncharacterized protein n=1 Tax=Flammeovirga agarivorans TaxID=2726742 RepID=A0A7X8SN83_9BACT|nr:hypothetical protein [Flammeovirga agarivorans]NLR93315.1 hypothetical protein [Flammeovirga agarivorans]
MRFKLYITFILFLSFINTTVFSQVQVYGEKGILDTPMSWGSSFDISSSFQGKKEVIHLTRNHAVYGGVMFDLNMKLDLSSSKKISFTAFYPQPIKEISEHTIMLGVREKGSNTQFQALKKFKVTKFNSWETYEVEVDPIKGVDYKSVVILVQPGSQNGKADGLEIYISEVNVPGVEAEHVLVQLSTDNIGENVFIDILSNGDIDQKVKKTVFSLIKNGYKTVPIKNVKTDQKRITLQLSEPITSNDNLLLSFGKGKIIDANGKELLPFKHKVVKNNIPIDYEVYTDFCFEHKYTDGKFYDYCSNLRRGVQDPSGSDKQVMLIESTDDKNAAVLFDLQTEIDLTRENKFKVNVFVPTPPEGVQKIAIKLCLREDRKDLKQLSKEITLSTFNNWVECTFDLEDIKAQKITYNSFCLIFNPEDRGSIKGLEFYIKDFKGPKKIIY